MRISDWSSDVCSSDLEAVAPPRSVNDIHALIFARAIIVGVNAWSWERQERFARLFPQRHVRHSHHPCQRREPQAPLPHSWQHQQQARLQVSAEADWILAHSYKHSYCSDLKAFLGKKSTYSCLSQICEQR